MKIKYSLFITLLAVTLSFPSCNVTDTVPEDILTDATFWNSASDLELYANDFYAGLGHAHGSLDGASDITPNRAINTLIDGQATHSYSNNSWDFARIRALNYFMDNYGKVVGEEAKVAQHVGEIRFFRAKEFHSKVKLYGDFPWYETALNSDDIELIYKARDPRAFVVGKIIEDLEFACENIPTAVVKGRLHKYVAYMELARVCLYEGTRAKYAGDKSLDANALIQKAVDAAKYVMDNGGYEIVLNTPDYVPTDATPLKEDVNYHSLFTQIIDINDHKEMILVRSYIKDLAMHNLSRESGGDIGLSKAMMNLYLCRDGKSIAHSEMYLGDATLSDEVSNRDKRLYQIIENEFSSTNFTAVGGFISVEHPAITPFAPTGYNLTKHKHADPAQSDANQCYTQWVLYRYAETLLIYAEGMEELGKFDQGVADMTINKLRERGDVARLMVGSIETDPNWLDYGHTISAAMHEIRRERAIELIVEGFRHDDIYRWRAAKLYENPLAVYGITVSAEKLALEGYKSTFDVSPEVGGVNTIVHTDGKRYVKLYASLAAGYTNWDDAFYLRPVPKTELTLNENLVQTPGWENR